MSVLVIIPCGQRKKWDVDPNAGPVPARDAYIGVPFRIHRKYAERFADRWLILSAKYGLISPDFVILENYNVTFKRTDPPPVTLAEVCHQVQEQGLEVYDTVIALGGSDYISIVRRAFPERQVKCPFAGQRLGDMLHSEKEAVATGKRCWPS